MLYKCLTLPVALSVSFRVVPLMFDISSLSAREKRRCNIGN